MDNMEDLKEFEEFLKAADLRITKEELDKARERSLKRANVARKTREEKAKIDIIKKRIAAVVLGATVLVGGVTFGVKSYNAMTSPLNMTSLSREIGAIVQTTDDVKLSVLSQNTHRNQNGYYYNQEEIAKDLLKLDDGLFDYAFCTVCDEMGSNINNKVGVGDRSNIDAVIYYLKDLSSDKDSKFFNEMISKEFANIETFNDYLLSHGYVDKYGGPSIEQFKDYCNSNAQNVLDILENMSQERGNSI